MEALLKWAIINGATASEDAPKRDAATEESIKQKKLDPAIIDAILGKPASVQMTECLDAIENKDTPLKAREIALDDLEMLVENIDNASNLQPLGLWPRIIRLFEDPEPSVREGALWVSGTAVQHNPSAQKAFNGLGNVLAVLRNKEEAPGVRAKALYCVSSFVRANVTGLTQFVADNGLAIVVEAVDNGGATLKQKAFFLLRALIDEAMDDETPEELRPGKHLIDAIVELGAVDATASAAAQLAAAGEAAAFEQALGFLNSLADATEGGNRAVKQNPSLRLALAQASSAFGDWAQDDIFRITAHS
ncbi:hsp70 nucleotide exchange factor fes1 [Coemansia erecta]|uniref:Hsp70 nucleotide exchange factor fes1 n=1 Tax=Coemansia asiatica TaxID=1052880 RepID=A0A9W8CK22_9FUNG|nr:hsp70 nucleotide exchange factor fes1 [Coemansia asiatica]KAJ2843118.1 hsp70 nucleotide exchange factor fes1 [Coemansia erecta]KAJ2889149.1 hsp70 nucleotide exchange factor fes1 [Coemansia asiatica]